MRTVDELARASEAALALVARQADVREAEVFVSANSAVLTRLNYTSHIPCNGVEEPKSTESYGLGIQAVFDTPEGRRIGFGSEPSDLSARGRRARAGQGAPRGRRRSRVRLAARAHGRRRARSPTTTIRA